jgi:RNA polymerase sigma-70 factor (ECF subfamily)
MVSWIFTIARNCGIDRRRRTSRFVSSPAEQDLDEPDDSPSAEDRLIGWQNEAAVRAALTQLPEDQATVIRMSFYADSAQAEIAEQLGIPLGTVKSRVRLALQRLRRIMMEDTK